MKITVFHATFLGFVESILEKGLIPGFHESPGQDWRAKYCGKGIYFHSKFPEHELYQYHSFEDIIEKPEEADCTPVVIKVETEIVSEELIPEEEEIWFREPEPGEGIDFYKRGCGVVVLRKIDVKDINKVYYADKPLVNEYVRLNLPDNELLVPKNVDL